VKNKKNTRKNERWTCR